MKIITGKKIQELLKSGNFTVLYHDSDCATIHEGHISYDAMPENEDRQYLSNGVNECGYAPAEVVALVKALGGKVDSI